MKKLLEKKLPKKDRPKLTSQQVWEKLVAGNERFRDQDLSIDRDYSKNIQKTKNGQSPMAAFVSCIDSRVPVEVIFDLAIGEVFNSRVAGNFINNDILGGLEFAYGNGIKLIFVLGHTGCGAIDAAIANCKCPAQKTKKEGGGHVLPMIDNLCNSVCRVDSDLNGVDRTRAVIEENVWVSIENIRLNSELLRNAELKGEIQIRGGVYEVTAVKGEVTFFEYDNPSK